MKNRPKRSLTERGLSLLCAAAMVAGMVLGNLDMPRAAASEQVLVCGQDDHKHDETCYDVLETMAEMTQETTAKMEALSVAEPQQQDEPEIQQAAEETQPQAAGEMQTAEAVPESGQPSGIIESIVPVEPVFGSDEDASGSTSQGESNVQAATDETENEEIWKQSVQNVKLTGDYAKDIVAIAETQLGVRENKENFSINIEGTAQYYSRYGQWYGDAYGEWSAMFVSFCAAYAQIPEQYLPREKDNSRWVEELGSRYVGRDGYTPQAGDIVFFSENPHKDGTAQFQSGNPAHVGIVVGVDAKSQTLTTIEGNVGGEVSRQQYSLGEETLAGYMSMAKVTELAGVQAEEKNSKESETAAEIQEESEIPTGTGAPEFMVVKMVAGDVAHWVMGAEGTDHSWQTLNHQEIIRIEDGSGDTAKIMPLAAGKVFLIHNYKVGDELYMETFEVDVLETAAESETETETEVESETEAETETETESETETERETGAETETETETEAETETETETEIETETGTEIETETETEIETETVPEVMTYENDEVVIHVTEVAEGAIPENATLRVVPLTKEDASTAEQYAQVEAKLFENAEQGERGIAGFLAYDISFVDEDGNEIEPNDEVEVSIDYKKTAIPVDVDLDLEETPEEASEAPAEEDAEGIAVEGTRYAGITILHLEEDEAGQVTDVVDMSKNNQIIGMDITDQKEVQSAQFLTDSFSTFAVTWQNETVTTYDLEATGDTVTETPALTHENYVSDKGDGTYDLTLTVSGAVGSTEKKAELDLVLVMDTSANMAGTNMEKAREAAAGLVSTLNRKSETIDARWKLVTFADNAEILTPDWTTGDSVNAAVQELNGDGGANYQDALVKAQTAVSTAGTEAVSVVIFLTCGGPTFYLRSGDTISNSGTAASDGGDGTSRNDYNGAVMGANALSCNRFYAVGIGLGANVYDGMSGLALLENVAKAVNTGTREAQNVQAEEVAGIFGDIAANITTLPCSNVTVTDTLSDYVDIVKEAGEGDAAETEKLRIAVYDSEGSEVASGIDTVKLDDGAVELTAAYESATKQITMDFPDDYELQPDYTYAVTASISPNEYAEEVYQSENGYLHTGDAGTDAVNNDTSSGKEGFYANKEDSATVTYMYKEAEHSEKYAMPVVQLSGNGIPEVSNGGTSSPAEQEPNHEKYIRANTDNPVDPDNQNTYDLTLTIAGKVGNKSKKAKLDIMLIVDSSASMLLGNKIAETNKAVDTLVKAINPEEVDARWNLVSFNTRASAATGWTENGQTVYNNVARLNFVGYTNYQDALVKAAAGMESARDDATKIIIFLTDGNPTYHLCSAHRCGIGECTHTEALNNDGSACHGGGGSGWVGDGTSKTDYEGARMGANAIAQIADTKKCDQFYAIGIGLKDKAYEYETRKWMSGKQLLQNVKNATGVSEGLVENVSESELEGIFQTIAQEATKYCCSDVTITDTLSPDVEWIEGTDLVIEVKNKDGNTVYSGKNTVTLSNGKKVTASYDASTHQIVLDFDDDYELEPGYVYSVTAKITPTEAAYDKYIANAGYQQVKGDPHTDAEGNTTSSNQPGFYSNATANVTYTYNEEPKTSTYAKPVVQVYKSELKLKKLNNNNKPLKNATFGVYSVTENTNGEEVISTAPEKLGTSDATGWINFGSLTHGTYLLKEISAPRGYAESEEGLRFTVRKGKIEFASAPQGWTTGDINPTRNGDKYTYEVTVIDELKVIDFNVTKEWKKGEDGAAITGTDPVQVKLIATDEDGVNVPFASVITEETKATETVSLTAEKGYFYTWEGLKKYTTDQNGDPWKEITYSVKEVGEKGDVIQIGNNRYCVQYEQVSTDGVTTGYRVINTKWIDWSIVKKEYDTDTPLAGAEFELKSTPPSDVTYYGMSGSDGVIQWYEDSNFSPGKQMKYVPSGEYTLSERKAPSGYSKSGVVWNISVDAQGKPEITQGGKPVESTGGSNSYTYRFDNYKLYELPSTGSRGIYWYLIGGMLLMMAASLILYKTRCKEVLKG